MEDTDMHIDYDEDAASNAQDGSSDRPPIVILTRQASCEAPPPVPPLTPTPTPPASPTASPVSAPAQAMPAPMRRTGIVRWFEDKTIGYGFIEDIYTKEQFFAHISELRLFFKEKVKLALYTGEYVTFSTKEAARTGDKRRATDVRGIAGGPLLCEHGVMVFHQYNRKL